MAMSHIDPHTDDLDGVLFRFWCRAASYPGGWPSDLMKILLNCREPHEYRAALLAFAQEKGVNLPVDLPLDS